ncbi:transcription initiation factor TFIID subunit 11 [Nematocida sp. LUAm3]|nr:transcription initiation factor TFIID subunit 11 [Nematocida sp. LUAm3]KAI5176405.1 transcription initiation factor TFIID subunit 11 [Nematocida sp. LUAm2]KAI5179306.1 transcription initiation factor TFIID subunit 11 [Nematocida sp. LUAm1]
MREDEDDPREETSEEEIQSGLNLNEEELSRYGAFRGAGFNKPGIRKFVTQILNQTCNPNFTIVLSGIAKVFVSELIEGAKEVQSEWNNTGELLPSHVHESYRRLCHKIPNMQRFP